MAFANMGFTRSAVNSTPEILFNADYVGDAITLDTTAFADGLCKAGTPIGEGGVIANTADAKGILLHDVAVERPQATIVIGGYINTEVAQKHSGVTIAEVAREAMKNVVFC